MTPENEQQFADLTERYLNESLSDEQFTELQSILLDDRDARTLFLDLTQQHASLRLLDDALVNEQLLRTAKARPNRLAVALAATAALIAVTVSVFQFWPKHVATLVSSEDATWESPLPTVPGSRLEPDYLRLKAGVATIRFDSGAEVVLEAPAHIVLETEMQGRLLEGSAVITVPESAIGFVMESPDAFAVDHGTQFAMSVDVSGQGTTFEVLSGEISVHHESSGNVIRLNDSQAAAVTADGIKKLNVSIPEGTLSQPEKTLRLKSEGLEASVIRDDNSRFECLHQDLLMLKTTAQHKQFDRRAFFGFSLSGVDLESVQSASLRLNLVPTGLGFATRLTEVNTFAIYALPDEFTVHWNPETLRWDDVPDLKDCRLVGTFDIPRSRQRGSFRVETPEVLDSLKATSLDKVVFLALRQTPELQLGGLVHAFASSTHPEASGPSLELSLNNQSTVEGKAKH
jgi:hypothetical protein